MYDDEGNLVYLYRVIDGLCTRSQAFSAALTVGLSDAVIRRANEVRRAHIHRSMFIVLIYRRTMIDSCLSSSYWIKSNIIKYFIRLDISLTWTSKYERMYYVDCLFIFNSLFSMVNLVEKAVEVDVHNDQQITHFFHYVQQMINKYVNNHSTTL
jgi:hypothetical protein